MDTAILKNLANWLMLEKCKELAIDPSGSHVEHPRGRNGERVYTLTSDSSDRPFMQVTFTKNSAPRFIYIDKVIL